MSDSGKKEKRRQSAAQRKNEQPLRRELRHLEQQLEKLQTQKADVSHKLADPSIYNDGDNEALKALSLKHTRLEKQLNETEEQWLMLSEELEQS